MNWICRVGLLLSLSLTGCAQTATPPAGSLSYDKSVFSALLADHEEIRRTVTEIPEGVETVTESDDPAIAARLMDHVTAMQGRLRDGRRLRQWDPLYVTIFDHADKVDLAITQTAKGIRVRETSTDPYVVSVIKSHAGVVSGFVAHGFDEAAKEHPVPDAPR